MSLEGDMIDSDIAIFDLEDAAKLYRRSKELLINDLCVRSTPIFVSRLKRINCLEINKRFTIKDTYFDRLNIINMSDNYDGSKFVLLSFNDMFHISIDYFELDSETFRKRLYIGYRLFYEFTYNHDNRFELNKHEIEPVINVQFDYDKVYNSVYKNSIVQNIYIKFLQKIMEYDSLVKLIILIYLTV